MQQQAILPVEPIEPLTDEKAVELANGRDLSDLDSKDDETLVAEAKYHRQQAEHNREQMLWHFVEMGRRLLVLHSRLRIVRGSGSGVWASTVQAEVGVSDRYARYAMDLARSSEIISELPADTTIAGALNAVQEVRREERRERQAAVRSEKAQVITPDEALPLEYRLEVADCVSLPLETSSVDIIVTSPPYNLGKSYKDSDDEMDYNAYLSSVDRWCRELFRIGNTRARICLNIPLDITRGGVQPIYSDWLNSLLDAGWHYRFSVVWNEGNVTKSFARGSIDSPVAPHVFAPVEMVIVAYKGDWNLGRGGQHTLDHEAWLSWTNGLWTFPGENRSDYPAAFPEELPKRCISLLSFSDAVVCDPFMGSGTTGVAALRLGRTFYGFDVSEEAVNVARARIALLAGVG